MKHAIPTANGLRAMPVFTPEEWDRKELKRLRKRDDTVALRCKSYNGRMPPLHSDILRMAKRGRDCATISIMTGAKMSLVADVIARYP